MKRIQESVKTIYSEDGVTPLTIRVRGKCQVSDPWMRHAAQFLQTISPLQMGMVRTLVDIRIPPTETDTIEYEFTDSRYELKLEVADVAHVRIAE